MYSLQEYHFNSIYKLADLIDESVNAEVEFWNFDDDYFIRCATRFSKETLLHLYIVVTAMNDYHRFYRRHGGPEDHEREEWYSLFETYGIEIEKYRFDKEEEESESTFYSEADEDEDDNYEFTFRWFEQNSDKFELLFEKMADEVFYILFSNRNFLLKFNELTVLTVREMKFPSDCLTIKGTIKRIAIPNWVKKAVFHRDKGRCVYCSTDLTNLINTLTASNYDHIVPLDLFGSNDPCNIQLACEHCNKSKGNRNTSTSNKYIPWWT